MERLFVTGVSPVTMDDVTSGFNIGANLSLRPEFNEMLGFTEREVRHIVEAYRDLDVFDQDVETALDTMREWYDGYRFAETAESVIYNTDMVLHYLKHSVPNKRRPAATSSTATCASTTASCATCCSPASQLDGNFELLRQVISEGRADSGIVETFPLAQLTRPENFLSLMHYFGLLSIRDVAAGVVRLGIPNQTVRRLMYGYLRDAYAEVGVFSLNLVDFDRLTRRMALHGRLAAGGRAPEQGGERAHRRSRLHAGREGPARIPRGLPERIGVLCFPHGAGAGEGLRGHRCWCRWRRAIPACETAS